MIIQKAKHARAEWKRRGEVVGTPHKWTRRAFALGALGVAMSLLGFGGILQQKQSAADDRVADGEIRTAEAQYDADLATYEQQASDYQRCLDRVKSGSELRAALTAGVDHAEQTEAVFALVVSLYRRDTAEQTDRFNQFAAAVEAYQESIDGYRAFVEEYDVVELADCPPEPGDPPVRPALVNVD